MNQEYIKRVSINYTGAYTILVWYDIISWGSIWEWTSILDLAPNLFRQLHPKEGVYRFTEPIHTPKRWKIPQNYYYSSGLNNPNGYK
jgi:hypothetical protein